LSHRTRARMENPPVAIAAAGRTTYLIVRYSYQRQNMSPQLPVVRDPTIGGSISSSPATNRPAACRDTRRLPIIPNILLQGIRAGNHRGRESRRERRTELISVKLARSFRVLPHAETIG